MINGIAYLFFYVTYFIEHVCGDLDANKLVALFCLAATVCVMIVARDW